MTGFFYVYELRDPRTGLPFYVGKGQGKRAWEHERVVIAGNVPTSPSRKFAKISEILNAGYRVEVCIVAEYDMEADALDHEYRLVDADPTLTNVMPGGIGPAETPAQIERRRKAWWKRYKARRNRERREAYQRDTERTTLLKRNRLLKIPGAQRHQVEIAAWLEAHPRG
jgi:hypothetical protein